MAHQVDQEKVATALRLDKQRSLLAASVREQGSQGAAVLRPDRKNDSAHAELIGLRGRTMRGQEPLGF